jgi:hypothetical protein
MTTATHWTQGSTDNFVYSISSSFTAQIECKMEKLGMSRSELAARLNKTTGRVSQVLNDPGNLGLKLIVEYARELDMKVSIVAYDDHDPNNYKGPIIPDVFVTCWENAGRPRDLFETASSGQNATVSKNPGNYTAQILTYRDLQTQIAASSPFGKPTVMTVLYGTKMTKQGSYGASFGLPTHFYNFATLPVINQPKQEKVA